MSNNDLLSAALKCIKAGVSIMPIDHTTKRPAADLLPQNEADKASWKPYQDAVADAATVREWFNAGIQAFGVVGGKVSGGLLVLDFDVPRFYDAWRLVVGELADGLPVQQTGGGGYQVFLRCPAPGSNDKLAWAPDDTEETGRTIAIETRAEGGYAVVAPSLHPSGRRYTMLVGSLAAIPMVAQARADALIAAARKLDEAPRTRQEQERLETRAFAEHRKRQAQRNGQADIIGAYNASHPIEALLEQHGYTKGPRGRHIRPGGKSESVSVKDGHSCHWSSNDPLNDGKVISGCGVHDAFDLYAHFEHGGNVTAAVKAIANLPGMKMSHRAQSRAQAKPKPTVERFVPFPVDALPEPVRSFVNKGARALGCDPSFVALPLLAGLASAIGNTRRIELKRGWTEPAVIWVAIVGESGTLKSPALELALRRIRKLQHEAMLRHDQAMEKYRVDLLCYEKDLAAWKRDKKPGNPPAKPKEPVAERYWGDDMTLEVLIVILQENWRGVLMVRDELAGWLGSFDRYAKGKGGEAPKWLEMFGGRPVTVDRKTGIPRTLYVPRAAVSIVGGIQPGTLRRALGDEHRENGLAARLLLACPPRKAKRWTEEDISQDMETTIDILFDMLYSLKPEVSETTGEPEPFVVKLTPEAKTVWETFFNEHSQEQLGFTGDLAAAWSKKEGYAARLALVVHYARWAGGDSTLADPDMVDAASIEAGVKLARWFANEDRRVYAILAEGEGDEQCRQLVELIGRKGGKTTARELQQASRLFKTAEEAESALAELVEAGIGTWEPLPPGPAGGRPSKVFRLNQAPAVYETPPDAAEKKGFVDVDGVDAASSDDEWGEA